MISRAARAVPQQFNSSWKRSFHVTAVAQAKLNVEGLADKVNLSGQNVLVRVDLNVPLAKVTWPWIVGLLSLFSLSLTLLLCRHARQILFTCNDRTMLQSLMTLVCELLCLLPSFSWNRAPMLSCARILGAPRVRFSSWSVVGQKIQWTESIALLDVMVFLIMLFCLLPMIRRDH